jgi:hypothetical protein
MKKIFTTIVLVLSGCCFIVNSLFGGPCSVPYPFLKSKSFVIQQIPFDPNNINTYIENSGIFNRNIDSVNTPGFEWPAGSGKFAVFTTGLTIGCYVNNNLLMASASYKGECAPGYVIDTLGNPLAMTDSRFKFYKVSRGDNMYNNPDWANWGLMVPFGAPYIDVNHNGIYEPAVDTPGIRGAKQTIFICMTDGFPDEHQIGEGFGGGTLPIFAELHLTAWAYDNPGLEDMQFLKWDVINKNTFKWDSTYFAIIADPDLGDVYDDYIGCDTVRRLSYCYNSSNYDLVYGSAPPAVGIVWLNCAQIYNTGITSFTYFTNTSTPGPICEKDPNGELLPAYYYLKGLKSDATTWVIPQTYPPRTTKFCYPGDPETGSGWTEYGGQVENCGGYLTGTLTIPTPPGDRRFIMSSGSPYNVIHPGDTQKVLIAQIIAKGTSNKNSVTKLKQLADAAKQLCEDGFIIGINNISSNIPSEYKLFQNYPNPFNPSTKIKFSISLFPLSERGVGGFITLKIYDLLGHEVATLVNEQLHPGTYEVDWDGTNYSSGVYFYKLSAGDFSESKKMILLK